MNYNAQVLSNDFKVKDKELVKRLLGSAGFYVNECDDSLCFYNDENSAYLCDMNLVSYNNIPISVQTDYNDDEDLYNDIEKYTGVKEEDFNEKLVETQDFFKFLQEQLLDGEAIQVTQAGNEGLRYQGACGLVITKKAIKWFNLNKLIQDFTKENI